MEKDITFTFTPQQLTELFDAVESHYRKVQEVYLEKLKNDNVFKITLNDEAIQIEREQICSEIQNMVRNSYINMKENCY